MKNKLNIILWGVLLLAILFGAALELRQPLTLSSRLGSLPQQGALFSSTPLPLSPHEETFYGKAEVLKRIYRLGNTAFILIAIDGSTNRHAVHDPLYCLTGSGWTITNKQTISIDGGSGALLNLSKGEQQRQAVFWFSNGTSRHASTTRYWIQATVRRLTFGNSGDEPIMVILQSIPNVQPDWERLLDNSIFLYDI